MSTRLRAGRTSRARDSCAWLPLEMPSWESLSAPAPQLLCAIEHKARVSGKYLGLLQSLCGPAHRPCGSEERSLGMKPSLQSGAMTLQERIATMQERIVKAESERDSWRAAGMREKYLEAY